MAVRHSALPSFLVTVLLGLLAISPASADDAPESKSQDGPPAAEAKPATDSKLADNDDPVPATLERLTKQDAVWVDRERKLVVADGRVCLRQGVLELFACPRGGKEHESIVSIAGKAWVVHAGLLLIGAKPGTPVEFDPEYKPATGVEVDIWVLWKDKEGMQRKVRAQQWVREAATGKEMSHKWIFAGSSFYKDEETGKESYRADITGDFICVSNFATATLDLPVMSSADNADLLFEPFTERIPPIGTHVRLVLIPKLDK